MSHLNLKIRTEDDPAAWMVSDRDLTHSAERIILRLDPKKRKVTLTTRSHDIGGTLESVYHRRQHEYRVDKQVDATRFRAWLEKHSDLLRRICDGHTVEWDGSNHVGRLTDDAREASEELQHLLHPAGRPYGFDTDLPTHDIVIVEASMHLAPSRTEVIDEFGITADTTEERLEEIAHELEDEARYDAGAKLVGTLSELEAMREELREEEVLA